MPLSTTLTSAGVVVNPISAAPRFPAKATFVAFGDSMTARTTQQINAYTVGYGDRSPLAWFIAYSGQRLRLVNNAGVSGETTTQMRARLYRDVLAYSPGVVSVLGGYNDIANTSGTAADLYALVRGNLRAMYHDIIASGAILLAISILPSGLLSASAEKREAAAMVNRWIRDFCMQTPGAIFVDAYSHVVDPTSTTGLPIAGYFAETPATSAVHPSSSGAQKIGAAMWAALSQNFGKVTGFAQGLGAVASSTAEFGNMLTNPTFYGTGGTIAGNGGSVGISGSVASNWIARSEDATLVAVGSKVNRTDLVSSTPWTAQQFAISNFGSGTRDMKCYNVFDPPTSGWGAGDQIYAMFEVAVTAASNNIQQIKVNLSLNNSSYANPSGLTTCAVEALAANDGNLGSTGTIWLRTPDLTLPAYGTAADQYRYVIAECSLLANSSAAATFQILRGEVCKVIQSV